MAWTRCANCGFHIVRRDVPTGKQFVGPFWRKAWVHADSGETACWFRATPLKRAPKRAEVSA